MSSKALPDEVPQPKGTEISLRQVLSSLWRGIAQIPGSQATFILGVVYVLGFVVTNTYYGSTTAVTFGLLEGKYVAAGLLLVIYSFGPSVAGVLLGEATFRGTDSGNPAFPKDQRKTAAIQGLVTLLASWALLVEFLLPVIGAPGATDWRLPYAAYFGLCVLLSMLLALNHWRWEGRGGTFSLLTLSGLLCFPFILAVYFSFVIFPEVSPTFGGGGGWLAQPVSVSGPALPRDDSTVLVVLVGEGLVTAVTCPDRSGDAPAERWMVPIDEFGPVRIHGTSSLRGYLGQDGRGRTCSMRRRN